MPPPSLKSSQSTSSSHKPSMTHEEFLKTLNKIMKDYLKNPIAEVSFLLYLYYNEFYYYIYIIMNYYVTIIIISC